MLDVGDRVVDLVPSPVKELAIDWFGTADKTALLIGIGVVLTIYAAVVGIVALRGRRRLGMAGIAVFGLVGALASLGWRDDRPVTAVLPSLLGAVTGAAALWWLCTLAERDAGSGATSVSEDSAHRAGAGPFVRTATGAHADRRGEPDVPGDGDPVVAASTRRAFLGGASLLVAVGVVAGASGRWLGARFSAAAARAKVVLPRPLRPLAPIPATTAVDVEGVSPFVTPNEDFYRIDTALSVPQVDPENWSLRIDGMVDEPIELTYAQLLARDMVEADITLTCVSNEVGGESSATPDGPGSAWTRCSTRWACPSEPTRSSVARSTATRAGSPSTPSTVATRWWRSP